MWKQGYITIDGHTFRWEAKVYEQGSVFGIPRTALQALLQCTVLCVLRSGAQLIYQPECQAVYQPFRPPNSPPPLVDVASSKSNRPPGALKRFDVFSADPVLLSDFDCTELLLTNPLPYGNDLNTVPFCYILAGIQFPHERPPFFV